MKALIKIPSWRRKWCSLLLGCAVVYISGLLPVSAQESQEEEPECAVAAHASAAHIPKQVELVQRYRPVHDFATGTGITVAVIDTGVTTHPRLPEVIDGGDFIDSGLETTFDCDAHGTVVAGVIAARDTGDGIVGVAPDVRLLSLRQTSAKLSDSGSDQARSGTLASLTEALASAIDQGATVVNVSVVSCLPPPTDALGPVITVDTTEFDRVMQRAEAEGVVVVAAAGNVNNACPTGSTVYPAHHEKVVGVAALQDPFTKTDYTLESPFLQVSAPGTVYAGLNAGGDGLSHGVLGSTEVIPYEGTSFAAPFVSGVVALLQQRYPQASAAEIRSILYASVDPSSGMVDATRTIRYLQDTVPKHGISNPPPTTRVAATDTQVRFIWGGYGLVVVVLLAGIWRSIQNQQHCP